MHPLFHFAYLDPGTGSLIVQSIIGITAGVAVFGRKAIRNAGSKAKAKMMRTKTDPAKAE